MTVAGGRSAAAAPAPPPGHAAVPGGGVSGDTVTAVNSEAAAGKAHRETCDLPLLAGSLSVTRPVRDSAALVEAENRSHLTFRFTVTDSRPCKSKWHQYRLP